MPLLRKPALNRIRVDPLATNPRPGSKIKQSYKTDDENPENPMEKSRARHAATPSHPRVVFRHYTRCRDLLSVVKRRQIQHKHATSLWSVFQTVGRAGDDRYLISVRFFTVHGLLLKFTCCHSAMAFHGDCGCDFIWRLLFDGLSRKISIRGNLNGNRRVIGGFSSMCDTVLF